MPLSLVGDIIAHKQKKKAAHLSPPCLPNAEWAMMMFQLGCDRLHQGTQWSLVSS